MRFPLWRSFLPVLFLLIVGGVSASEILRQDECLVPPGIVIEGNLYVLCRDLNIEGTVRGNVIGAAYTTTITGTIEKNIYLLGGKADINGTIDNDIHFAGLVLNTLPDLVLPNGDLFAAALSITNQAGSQVSGGLVSIGYQLVIDGTVTGDVEFWGSALRIGGTVAGDVQASVGDSQSVDVASQLQTLLLPLQFNARLIDPGLQVPEGGSVAGTLRYQAPHTGEISGNVETGIEFDPLITSTALLIPGETEDATTAFRVYLSQVLTQVLTLGLIGLLGLLLVPDLVQRPIRTLRRQPVSSLGVGVLTFVLSFPVVLIALLFSLLLILILSLLRLDGVIIAGGMLLGIVNIGGTSLFYFVAIYISRMILAIALGRLLIHRVIPVMTPRSWFISLAVGVVVLALVGSLPTVGLLFSALAMFLGLGAILTVIQAELRSLRDAPTLAAPVYYPGTTSRTPMVVTLPPVLQDHNASPGMDNLPDGFDLDWFQEN